jgi:uncharacterized protein YacL
MPPSNSEPRHAAQSLIKQDRSSKHELRTLSVVDDSISRGGAWVLRSILLVASSALCYSLPPLGLQRAFAALAGFSFAALILGVEAWSRRNEPAKVLGAALGTACGIFVALLITLMISRTAEVEPGKSCLEYLSLFAFGYLGLTIGSSRGADLLRGWSLLAPPEAQSGTALKLVDTSVLIDGRIADISDAHFLDGVLGVPQFVLRELQMVADSSDPLKRQRGRRGLEVLQRMQKMEQLDVRVLDDIPGLEGDVDDKLVEVARRTGGKIVTNDFNLNKVATVHGIAVLNVNLLANAMKPTVLPGESMRVLILREGKEPNQGVAYLDDGTMVVVDSARRMINKSVDVIVTSVHQTTAGKMIFGRLDERAEQNAVAVRQAAAGTSAMRSDAGNNTTDVPRSGRSASLPERDA